MLTLKQFEPEALHLSVADAFTEHSVAKTLIALMAKAISEGHLCLPIEEFIEADQKTLLAMIQECPQELLALHEEPNMPLYYNHNCLYLHKTFKAESRFIEELHRFLKTQEQLPSYSFEPDPRLTCKQNEALKAALEPGLLLLTGGPGTGKTFTAKVIAQELLKKSSFFKPSLILAAPTSKALDQLKKSIGATPEGVEVIADTLHKLTCFRTKKPAYLNASCIIIDEASMIEAPLFAALFAALGSGAKVILMGDPHQLPPVGVGSLFQDLVAIAPTSPMVSHIHLDTIHRTQDSSLLKLAYLTHQLEYEPFLCFIKQSHENLHLIEKPLEAYHPTTFKVLADFFPLEEFYSDTLEALETRKMEHLILSTLRQGPLGVEAINRQLSAYFCARQHSFRYYLEPIMILKSSQGLFNGETGFKIYDRALNTISYQLGTRRFDTLMHYSPAFALSVHKAQGSEYAHILFMIPPGSEKFSREIIYTAITRVKKKLFLWIDQEPLQIALSKKNCRYSGLKYHFKGTATSSAL